MNDLESFPQGISSYQVLTQLLRGIYSTLITLVLVKLI